MVFYKDHSLWKISKNSQKAAAKNYFFKIILPQLYSRKRHYRSSLVNLEQFPEYFFLNYDEQATKTKTQSQYT